jgi:hypothetical protein
VGHRDAALDREWKREWVSWPWVLERLRQILAEVERLRGLASLRCLASSVDFHDVFVGPRLCKGVTEFVCR